EHHAEHRGREDLSLRVRLKRERSAAIERPVEEKVECAEVGELEPLDVAGDHPAEMLAHTIERDVAIEDGVPLGAERDETDVCDVDQRDIHATSTDVSTTRLSISAGQYATISSTLGRPPANPVTLGGPFSTSGAISRVNRSTAARSDPRTPMRSWTSGASCDV